MSVHNVNYFSISFIKSMNTISIATVFW